MAVPRDLVHDAMQVVRSRVKGCVFAVLPTVIQELRSISRDVDSPRQRQALVALESAVPRWGFQPVNFVPVGHGIVEVIADKIRDRGYLPQEERNDALILAEAALLGCSLLLTSDAHLLDVPPGSLRLLMDSHSVSTPLIVSPRKLVRDFSE